MCLQHVLGCSKHFIGPTLSSNMMYSLENMTEDDVGGLFELDDIILKIEILEEKLNNF